MLVLLQSMYYVFKDWLNDDGKNNTWGLVAFIGPFGSCKTTSLVNHILNRPKGYHYYTNFNMQGQTKAINTYHDILTVKSRSIVAIDELQNIYNNRAWGEFPPALLEMLTQVRKRNIEFIYTCQNVEMIDISVRRLTKYVVICSSIKSRYVINKVYDFEEFEKKEPVELGAIKFCSSDKLRTYFDTNLIIHQNEAFLNKKSKKK